MLKLSDAGARVAVVDIDAQGSQLVADSIGGIAVECDLADMAAIDSMITQVEEQIGPVDLCSITPGLAQVLGSSTALLRNGNVNGT